VPEEIIINIE